MATAADSLPVGVGEIADVEDVKGIRVEVGENNRPEIEYLVKWKDGTAQTWEPPGNLSDNLLRDFEDKWWQCCREGDEDVMKQMVECSPDVLPHCVDSNERSALHFAAALGKAESCRMLCEAGADVDLADKDGYTPLHMAVGYSFVSTVKILLEAGASPEIPDSQGRNVIQLVDSIRSSMPFNPQLAGKRIALEEVSALLTGNLFEEVVPRKILESRADENGTQEYLIQWYDGTEDSWVKGSNIAQDVVEDFEAGFEYATAERLLKMKKRGDERVYLVKWFDDEQNTWESEDNLSPLLIQAFEESQNGGTDKQLSLPYPFKPSSSKPSPNARGKRRKQGKGRRSGNSKAKMQDADGIQLQFQQEPDQEDKHQSNGSERKTNEANGDMGDSNGSDHNSDRQERDEQSLDRSGENLEREVVSC